MIEVYRFRSMKCLLDDPFRELERQTIFFSHPEELNDPVEDLQDIVWRGDHILWSNLLRHYTYCLSDTVAKVLKHGNEFNFDPLSIPITRYWDKPRTPQAKHIPDAAWRKFRDACQLQRFTERIARNEPGVRRDELIFLLTDIHDGCLRAIRETFREYSLTFTGTPMLGGCRPNALHHSDAWLGDVEQFDDTFLSEVDWREVRLGLLRELAADLSLPIGEISRRPGMLLTMDFPRVYVDELKRLLQPNWYTACFTMNCNSVAMWSHYGANHTGACLIFDVLQTDDSIRTKEGIWLSPWQKVSYEDRLIEVDFFGELAYLGNEMLNFWYRDENEKMSERIPKMKANGGRESELYENLWDRFMRRARTKTKEWEQEQETRLILADTNAGIKELTERDQDDDWRTLNYQFSFLKGIIFGQRASPENIWDVIDIISKKCKENERDEFQLFQAFYSPRTGDIRRRPLRGLSW